MLAICGVKLFYLKRDGLAWFKKLYVNAVYSALYNLAGKMTFVYFGLVFLSRTILYANCH